MGKAIDLREDFDAGALRRLAKLSRDAVQTRRFLALASIYDGGSRSQAAEIGDVTLQVIRDWVLRFNADGPDGLIDRKAPGRERSLEDDQRAALARAVEAGPNSDVNGVVRWRLVDLASWLHDEFAVTVSRQTVGRELRTMGFRKLSARPQHHAQDAGAIEAFKKTSRPR